jgi:GNAT superfamily N-acetyltransferase
VSPTVSVRPAIPSDVDDICSLIIGLAEYEDLRHEVVWTPDVIAHSLFGDQPAANVLIAFDDTTGAVTGFALWYPTFSTFLGSCGIWLEDLFVREEHRGKGFGLQLLQTLRTMTKGRLEWSVLDWNEPSIAFYRSIGARPVSGWTRYRWTLDPD